MNNILSKIIPLIFMLMLFSCTYKPIFSEKNYNFKIDEIIFKGEKDINKEIEKNIHSENLKENYKKILILFSPAIPHLTSECLDDLGVTDRKEWPRVNKKFLQEDKIDYVIQINGKKRLILNENKDMDQDSLLDKIKMNQLSEKYIKNKTINKIIFVKNKLINLLIHE